MQQEQDLSPSEALLEAFRTHYQRLEGVVIEATASATDSVVLERIGDDLTQYESLVTQHAAVFSSEELETVQTNLSIMIEDIRICHRQSVDESHFGHPTIVTRAATGRRGQPRIIIDPDFLQWAHSRRSMSSLARFLGVSRTTLRIALVDQGLRTGTTGATADNNNNNDDEITQDSNHDHDDILDPNLVDPDPQELPNPDALTHNLQQNQAGNNDLSDEDLDILVSRLRVHYRRAGLSMLDGMLRRLGFQVPRERIRMSLLRIDPVRRVFERIRIRRRKYKVSGPNALWHHDGQHGLIRWGIIIHGFIDGYSRLITGLQASSNNYGDTVLRLFLKAASQYGTPSRLRGDHGTENILVAAWMEDRNGRGRGSYIWGRSIHNVRIERLWVDVTVQVGETWANLFTMLEIHHGLNINNAHHIWLLHFLFLPTINSTLDFFAQSWNEHTIQIRDGPNRSPSDMFYFDMITQGVRGSDVTEMMSQEELEVYGIDWEGLREDNLLQSRHLNNNTQEGSATWIHPEGLAPPPEHLNEVWVQDPDVPLTQDECITLEARVQEWAGKSSDDEVAGWHMQDRSDLMYFCKHI